MPKITIEVSDLELTRHYISKKLNCEIIKVLPEEGIIRAETPFGLCDFGVNLVKEQEPNYLQEIVSELLLPSPVLAPIHNP